MIHSDIELRNCGAVARNDAIRRKTGERPYKETVLKINLTNGKSRTLYGPDADKVLADLKRLA